MKMSDFCIRNTSSVGEHKIVTIQFINVILFDLTIFLIIMSVQVFFRLFFIPICNIFSKKIPIFKYYKNQCYGITVRSKAIGMLEAGVLQNDVALRLGAGLLSIERWWAAAKRGQSLETKARSGRPKILNRAAKIVIAKSLEKKTFNRHIAKSLAEKGCSSFSTTVYRYLTKILVLKHSNGLKSRELLSGLRKIGFFSSGIIRIVLLKIGERFFGQTNHPLNYFNSKPTER